MCFDHSEIYHSSKITHQCQIIFVLLCTKQKSYISLKEVHLNLSQVKSPIMVKSMLIRQYSSTVKFSSFAPSLRQKRSFYFKNFWVSVATQKFWSCTPIIFCRRPGGRLKNNLNKFANQNTAFSYGHKTNKNRNPESNN